MQDNPYLKKAYQLTSTEDTQALYQAWADTYDATLADHGYVTPTRCAQLLAKHMPDKSQPVLDVGCGTGISGLALQQAGFSVVDGHDLSEEMLKKAALHQGLYRHLVQADPQNPLDFATGTYQAIAAMGVIADKHAPPEMIGQLLDKLNPGGRLVFSLNNHTQENPAYLQACEQVLADGKATLLEQVDGPHLIKLEMTALVMVMVRA